MAYDPLKPPNLKRWGQDSSIPGSDFNSAIDFSQKLGPGADYQIGQYAPLQNEVIQNLLQLLQGDDSGIRQMFAPQEAAINSQMAQGQRRLQDTVPTSQLGSAMGQLENNALTARGQAYGQFSQPFYQQAMNTGANAMSQQVLPWLAAGGQIAKKPASGGGMS
jgi:hypothetical protein